MSARLQLIPLFIATTMPAQVTWSHLDASIKKLNPHLSSAKLTSSQKRAIVSLLEVAPSDPSDPCVQMPDAEGKARFLTAPLGRPHIVYVVSVPDCHGSVNGPLWLVNLNGGHPKVIARMVGWGLGIQPETHHGLHDFVVGTHLSAFETGLTWFQFDGRSYHPISQATAYSTDDVGRERRKNAAEHCGTLKQRCNLISLRYCLSE